MKIWAVILPKMRDRQRAAKAAAILMTAKSRPCHFIRVVEKAVGSGLFGPVIFADISVILIAAAIGGQLDLAAASASGGCIKTGYRTAKFLDRVDRRITDRAECLASCLIVGVDTVDRDIRLVGTGTRYRTNAICGCRTKIGPDDTRLQSEQCGR